MNDMKGVLMMKRYLLLLLAITMKMTSVAQNTTLPTVVEGRVWNVVRFIPAEPQSQTPCLVTIKTSRDDGVSVGHTPAR